MKRVIFAVSRKKGQSIMEYSVVFIAIIAVLLWAGQAMIQPSVNRYMNSAATLMDVSSNMVQTYGNRMLAAYQNYSGV